MGMLIDGKWDNNTDRFMVDGVFQREASALNSQFNDASFQALKNRSERFVLVASASCPWSHGAVIASVLCGHSDRLAVQWAGGPRIEGYGLLPGGTLSGAKGITYVHQLYSKTDPAFTGRTTVPVLWDSETQQILSNSSADIIDAFVQTGAGALRSDNVGRRHVEALTQDIFDGLSNAVYRAGLAEKQEEYDMAVDTVFATMDRLEARLADKQFLFGSTMTTADVRLFATLVRFDTVYATHFRCTRKRLVEYRALWRFARQIYQMPGIKQTIDFDEIRFGYYVNDGSHNPHNIVGQQPIIDWESQVDLA